MVTSVFFIIYWSFRVRDPMLGSLYSKFYPFIGYSNLIFQ